MIRPEITEPDTRSPLRVQAEDRVAACERGVAEAQADLASAQAAMAELDRLESAAGLPAGDPFEGR